MSPFAWAEAASACRPLLERCTFPGPGEPLVCAVSGGPDSTALLVLAVAAGCVVSAHHVDHGLRPGSGADAAVVRSVAGRLGVEVVVHRVVVAPGPNLEARAREARRSVLPAGIATGHTCDDQAETVVLNLLRGASSDGLAAMRAGRCHPLLGLRRSETHELCARLGIEVVTDETNADRSHRRNRVRHELLPAMCELAGRDVVPVLARQAQLLSDEGALLDALAAELDPTDVKALAAVPLPLARRAVRRWLRDRYPPDSATVERVLAVAAGEGRATDIDGARRVRRSRGRLHVAPIVDAPGVPDALGGGGAAPPG